MNFTVMKKNSFSISGYLLDENEKGIEGSVLFDGYQGSPTYNTKEDGYFIFEIKKISFWDLLFKHFLIIFVKTGDKTYKGKMGYNFRIRPNEHIKLKMYPYSKRVVTESKEGCYVIPGTRYLIRRQPGQEDS